MSGRINGSKAVWSKIKVMLIGYLPCYGARIGKVSRAGKSKVEG